MEVQKDFRLFAGNDLLIQLVIHFYLRALLSLWKKKDGGGGGGGGGEPLAKFNYRICYCRLDWSEFRAELRVQSNQTNWKET